MEVKNKVVIVTGGGSGIGAATVKHFAKLGAKVVVADNHPDGAQEIVDQIKQEGGEAIFHQVNVAKYEEVEVLVEKTIEHFGQ